MLDLKAVAERAGISIVTARNYHHAAVRRRRDGESRPGDLPPPDQIIGKAPAWLPATIDKWLANRPGQGKGGGRPSKRTGRRKSSP